MRSPGASGRQDAAPPLVVDLAVQQALPAASMEMGVRKVDWTNVSKVARLRHPGRATLSGMAGAPSPSIPVTDRTRLKRLPKRGMFDRAAVYDILDEGFVCHVGFVVDGQPFVIPTGYARVGDQIYLHGSAASRMVRTLAGGLDVCVTVTLVDGLVLARSAFHHSMNYRSVMILGQARLVTDPEQKTEALRAFTNHIVPDRWDTLRPVTRRNCWARRSWRCPSRRRRQRFGAALRWMTRRM
jgi:nitroimidazol reductase NimA-like FMN-containing flavoprotein (pyridoxamine 5'-phosphate oxidase superfamily)